jgi:hypothetical protein
VSEILGRPDLYSIFVQVVTIPQLVAWTLQEKATLLNSVLSSELDNEQVFQDYFLNLKLLSDLHTTHFPLSSV